MSQEGPGFAGLISIETRDFGRRAVPEDHFINFPFGLPGFPETTRYALLECAGLKPFLCLQCLDQADLAFAVIDPMTLVPDYQVGPVNSTILKELDTENLRDLQTLVIVTIPPGKPQEIVANLMAPLLINPRRRLAKQVVLESSKYSTRYRVFPN